MMKNCFYNTGYKYSPWVFFYLKAHVKKITQGRVFCLFNACHTSNTYKISGK